MSDDNVPESWLPLIKWRALQYNKQKEYVRALEHFWEVVFVGGNGTGKTLTLYWSLLALALGVHPCQFAKPPLRIKVLLNDFEHGFGKIFTETCMYSQSIPELWEVWNKYKKKKISVFNSEDKALEYIDSKGLKSLEVRRVEEQEIDPLYSEDQFMITKMPSRDDKTLYFYNKSFIFFQTSEQKKRQHSGTNFDVLANDEEPEKSKYDESKRGLRNAKGGGRILHAFTPPFEEETKNKGPSWTKFDLIDVFEEGKGGKDIYVVKAAIFDNPAITDDFIRRFSKGKTEEQIRIQLYGEYPTWGDAIFPEYDDHMWNPKTREGHLLPYDFPIPWEDPMSLFEMGLDWHGSKPPAVIWAYEVPNFMIHNGVELEKGDMVVFDEISPAEGKMGQFTISKTADAIREHEGWNRRRVIRYGDPKMKDTRNDLVSGFSPWQEFRHCGIRLVEGWNRDPYVGYSIIRDFLRGKGRGFEEHPRLFIRENCKTLRHQMKNHYNVPKGDGTAVPDPKFSDYPVCLKYIMQNKSRKVKKNMDRSGKHSRWPLQSFGRDYIERRV